MLHGELSNLPKHVYVDLSSIPTAGSTYLSKGPLRFLLWRMAMARNAPVAATIETPFGMGI